MIRPLYDWTMARAASPHAPWFLGIISFVESSIFPIPPDVLLIPMVLAERAKAWFFASLCTITSVLGGFAGYMIGALLFDSIGQPILDFYGYGDKFGTFQGWYQEWGAWIVFFAGVTPFPYKVITIASGVVTLDLITFGIASLLSRGLRFFIVAGLLWQFGPPIKGFIEKNLGPLTFLFFALLLGGFLVLKFL